MTLEQYNRIAELAEQGKTGIEIVAAINEEAQAKEEPEAKDVKEKDPQPEAKEKDPETESAIMKQLEALDARISKMQETFHAVNIMNSSQPEINVKDSKDILAECFAGYAEKEKGE